MIISPQFYNLYTDYPLSYQLQNSTIYKAL